MKLDRITFIGGNPPLPGFRELGSGHYQGWTVSVRGPSVFLSSPPGWKMGSSAMEGDVVTVCEVPRTSVAITWQLEPGDDVGDTREWPAVERAEPSGIYSGEPGTSALASDRPRKAKA